MTDSRWPRATTGSTFGNWTVVAELPNAAVRCACRCGTITGFVLAQGVADHGKEAAKVVGRKAAGKAEP